MMTRGQITLVLVGMLLIQGISAAGLTPQAAADKIDRLPGINGDSFNFNQYAGYLNVDETNDRNLFYWFVESASNPATDPLILWLQGGPGCSGLVGFLSEHGPFWVTGKGGEAALQNNPDSWNNLANVLYIEAPAGVGFSYSKNASDLKTGDAKTAEDNWRALEQFFARFPQFAGNKFYVTGESYGGHYVPDLTLKIVEKNRAGLSKINLGGFMLGNPLIGMSENSRQGTWPTWFTHGMISRATYDNLMKECPQLENPSDACNRAQNEAAVGLRNIDVYDLYVDVCNDARSASLMEIKRRMLEYMHSGTPREQLLGKPAGLPFMACVDRFMTTYLNRGDVQQALHASTNGRGQVEWNECSNTLQYSVADTNINMMPAYRQLLALPEKLHLWWYSGDLDSVCPYLDTQQALLSLNQTVVKEWHPWMVDGQVGGFLTLFDTFGFSTVRGAGHMVPEFQPTRGLELLRLYLDHARN